MKAILVDDEQLALDFLEHHLKKISDIEVIGTFINPIIGREKIINESVDVVFLDINLSEINGLELAEQILEHKPDLIIVFITAYSEDAIEAFELAALDYLVKPIKIERLKDKIDRIENRFQNYEAKPVREMKQLRIKVCNTLTFETVKDKFEPISWRTSKTQELFLYLLQKEGEFVSKAQIADLLWPDFEQNRAFSQLYTTIYHIRKALSKFNNHFQVKNMTEGYILTTNNVILNIKKWEKEISEAPPINTETIHTYLEIMELYSGPYLNDYEYLWADQIRHRFEQLWVKTAFQIADFYRAYDYYEKAEIWYEEICDKHPEAEEAYFSLMKIYDSMDNRLLVEHKYNQLKSFLKEELDVEPNKKIVNWYEQSKKIY